MKRFSERYGIVPPKELQVNELDRETRIELWNAYYIAFQPKCSYLASAYVFVAKERMDQIMSNTLLIDEFGDWHSREKWFMLFEFVEHILKCTGSQGDSYRDYIAYYNSALERNNVGYRIVGNYAVPITNKEEGEEIEAAMKQGGVVQQHIVAAVKLFSDRKNPDFRNSCNESISAVEALVTQLTGTDKVGTALKQLADETGSPIHKAFVKVFNTMYGHASDGGIRHALKEDQEITFEDARYYLVSCSAFINYLKIKASISEKEHDLT